MPIEIIFILKKSDDTKKHKFDSFYFKTTCKN